MTKDFKINNGKYINLIRRADHLAAGEFLADAVANRIKAAGARGLTICFPTGSTPAPAYEKLVQMHRAKTISFGKVRAFHLDEYCDLRADHPNSYKMVLKTSLFDMVDIEPANTHFFDFGFDDLKNTAADYEKRIQQAGGIDLMILGIGANGHIAFNEPGSSRESRTRVVKLTDQTLQRNAHFFDNPSEEPSRAITQGIANILEARSIILMATGDDKAEAIRQALCEPVSPNSPASCLQEYSGELSVVVDDGAASRLSDT